MSYAACCHTANKVRGLVLSWGRASLWVIHFPPTLKMYIKFIHLSKALTKALNRAEGDPWALYEGCPLLLWDS